MVDIAARQFRPSSSGTEAVVFSTQKAEVASRSMAESQPISTLDAERWVSYWISKKFL